MATDITLRPIHYASVSGGKDSFYMLNLILNYPEKYPLDMVVHFELEIDWDWSKRVIDFMEQCCKNAGIPFYRIKPRKTWQELYEKRGFPTRFCRWCNGEYKMDAKKQLHQWIKQQNCRPVAYIGFCADETSRFKYTIGQWDDQEMCYPLAEEGINENDVLEWAKTQPIFENWYKHMTRQGCKLCPMNTRKELAYMLKYEPDVYNKYFEYVREYERKYMKPGQDGFFHMPIEQVMYNVEHKWSDILNQEEQDDALHNM